MKAVGLPPTGRQHLRFPSGDERKGSPASPDSLLSVHPPGSRFHKDALDQGIELLERRNETPWLICV
jgi:hypothetical protein